MTVSLSGSVVPLGLFDEQNEYQEDIPVPAGAQVMVFVWNTFSFLSGGEQPIDFVGATIGEIPLTVELNVPSPGDPPNGAGLGFANTADA